MSSEQAAPILEIRALTKRYRRLTAVAGLTLNVGPGEFVALLGPNGAGKSTTMGCVASVVLPDAGEVRIEGVDPGADPMGARLKLGYVPQELLLPEYLTGQEYLELAATLRGVPEGARGEAIEEALKTFELTGARHRLIKEYSGGMARKIAICAAMMGPVRLLVLDESFVGLDPESSFALEERLVAFCKSGGAVVLSSHILDMVERLCTRFLFLAQGAIAADLDRDALTAELSGGPHKTLTQLYLRHAGKLDRRSVAANAGS